MRGPYPDRYRRLLRYPLRRLPSIPPSLLGGEGRLDEQKVPPQGRCGRITAQSAQHPTFNQPGFVVDPEQTGGRLADRGQWADVIDLAAVESVVFVDEAVLAEALSAQHYTPPEIGADIAGAHRISFPRGFAGHAPWPGA